ncbi:hypothetical protein GFL49_13105 [Rhizobium leguminosarum bv. viciae]|nr:hypothetical protein [Rhizobium leguminosarum bv. viciae]
MPVQGRYGRPLPGELKAVGIEISTYNPRPDEDGSAGRGLADVLAAALGTTAMRGDPARRQCARQS